MAELRVMHGLVSEAAHKITEAASEAMENLKKNGTVDVPPPKRYTSGHLLTLLHVQ